MTHSFINSSMKKMRYRAKDVPNMTKKWKNAFRIKRKAARKFLKDPS